jgi:hypothetical protein
MSSTALMESCTSFPTDTASCCNPTYRILHTPSHTASF